MNNWPWPEIYTTIYQQFNFISCASRWEHLVQLFISWSSAFPNMLFDVLFLVRIAVTRMPMGASSPSKVIVHCFRGRDWYTKSASCPQRGPGKGLIGRPCKGVIGKMLFGIVDPILGCLAYYVFCICLHALWWYFFEFIYVYVYVMFSNVFWLHVFIYLPTWLWTSLSNIN